MGYAERLLAEIEAAGEELRGWIFDPLEAATEDWNLSEVLDQAIDEGLSIRSKSGTALNQIPKSG